MKRRRSEPSASEFVLKNSEAFKDREVVVYLQKRSVL